MINPKACTNFNRTVDELQEFLIFCICVANKNADRTADTINRFLSRRREGQTPFEFIRELGPGLHNTLVAHKVGQYHRIECAIKGCLDLDLATCSLHDLLEVTGIGPKTARYFLLHTRQDCDYAVLDTHILSFMRQHDLQVPKLTPGNEKQYQQLEKQWIALRKRIAPKMQPADFDLLVWTAQSGRLDDDHPFAKLPGVKTKKAAPKPKPKPKVASDVSRPKRKRKSVASDSRQPRISLRG